MKSLAAGIVSFALAVFFAYVFINSSVDVINFTQISSTQSDFLIKNSQAEGSFKMFAVSLDFLDFGTFEDMFMFSTQIYVRGNYLRDVPMIPCQQDQWSALGDTYKQDFIDYDLQYMYCPNITQDFELKETFRSKVPTYVYVSLTACDNSSNPSCVPADVAQYLTNATA